MDLGYVSDNINHCLSWGGEYVQCQKLDVANIDGLTQLMWAAGQGHAETARFLVSEGTNKSLKEKLELTALEIAQKSRSCTDCGDVAVIKQYPEPKPHSVFETGFLCQVGS